jgi:hypothetical protein
MKFIVHWNHRLYWLFNVFTDVVLSVSVSVVGFPPIPVALILVVFVPPATVAVPVDSVTITAIFRVFVERIIERLARFLGAL